MFRDSSFGRQRQSPLLLLLAPLVLAIAAPASALQTGTTTANCGGCHYGDGGLAPELSVPAEILRASPGGSVDIPVTIEAAGADAFGILVQADDPVSGSLPELSVNALGLGHTAPIAGEGRLETSLTLDVGSEVGIRQVEISVLAALRNSIPEDDSFASAVVDVAVGCEPVESFFDADGDGFGDPASRQVDCSAPDGRTTSGGDCNDGDPNIFPGAPELCNIIDDNCDGERDEGFEFGFLYTDADEDGDGSPGETTFSCLGSPGLSANDLDCDDERADAFAGAQELCNGLDDDCDGMIDNDCGQEPSSGGGCQLHAAHGSASGAGLGWLALLLSLGFAGRRRLG